MYAGDTDVTDPSVSLNCVVEITIPHWSLFPTYQCGFSGFYMEEKKKKLKAFNFSAKNVYVPENSNAEGSEKCYMLLIFLLLKKAL